MKRILAVVLASTLAFSANMAGAKDKAPTDLKFPTKDITYLVPYSAGGSSDQMARAMVNYLIGLGHRRIACLAVPDHDVGIGIERKRGYHAALADNGIEIDPSLLVVGTFEYASGGNGVKTLMSNPGGPPTAIFTITDRLAVAAAGWLLRNGYHVPGDVSVTCLDDPDLLCL